MKNSLTPNQKLAKKIRQDVLPAGMSITEAAKRLGVSRPTLSKLLNGQAALSPEMALRLRETFGADEKKLLNIQMNEEAEKRSSEHLKVPVARYVPDFLGITAEQIETWGTKKSIDACNQLPVLVRRLIHATGRELQLVDFPGFGNAQRHGFDGKVLAGAAALNVPTGHSVWEVSTEQNPQRKAESDYQSRIDKLPKAQQSETTFVFVTTWNWSRKGVWTQKKNKLGHWKEVRAYDASDLEQWLETTIEPRIWLAEKIGIPTDGFRTIEACRYEWEQATKPQLTPKIFAPSIDKYKKKFQTWLESPPDRLFIVKADSREEGTAFIAYLLDEIDCLAIAPGNAVLFDSADTLKTLSESATPFIAVVCSEEVESSIGGIYNNHHCIIIRPHNAPLMDREPDIAIDLLDHGSFNKALLDMGIDQPQRREILAHESGLSRTVLRRRLSNVPAVRTPPWANKPEIAQKLIPLALVGEWDAGFNADREILETIADDTYDGIESTIAELCQIADSSPIWRIKKYRGIGSKIDTIFAVEPYIVEKHLRDFIKIAKDVLSETDPALDLPESERRMATLFNKVRREYSTTLRSSIRDTLIFLAVHEDRLFSGRLGIKVATEVSNLVKSLLEPLDSRKLESYVDDLPDFAEAAPDTFLGALKEDLKQAEPVLLSLFRPVAGVIFVSVPRAGLLWALEGLAWRQEYFMDVVNILAKLSYTEVNDNWVNKPMRSLTSIFHSWLPQTTVSVNNRIAALKELCKHFPEVGWQICIHQINGDNQIGEYNHFPRWHAVASNPVSEAERREFEQIAIDLTVNWPNHNTGTLSDLLPCLPRMGEEERMKALDDVAIWLEKEPDKNDRVEILKQLGKLVYQGAGSPSDIYPDLSVRIREISQKIVPEGSVERSVLSSEDSWDSFLIEQLYDPDISLAKWYTGHEKRRKQAISKILRSSHDKISDMLEFLHMTDAGHTLGYQAASHIAPSQLYDIVKRFSAGALSPEKIKDFMQGFFKGFGNKLSVEVLLPPQDASDDDIARTVSYMPYSLEVWHLLNQLPEHICDKYWKNANVPLNDYSGQEMRILVNNLLRVGRPWHAFYALSADWNRVETSVLKRLLQEVIKHGVKQTHNYGLAVYSILKALELLAKRPGVSVEELAKLEFDSIKWIPPKEREIPNLEKQLAESPTEFVFLLSLITNRRGGGQDPEEWHIESEEQKKIMTVRAYEVLRTLRKLPGQNDQGEINSDALYDWISRVRCLASEHGRTEICDLMIGQWLSRASSQKDTPWPRRPICKALQSVATDGIGAGFSMGVRNANPFSSRPSNEGGDIERKVAIKYREKAEVWMIEFPFVSKILRSIADGYERDAEQMDHVVQVWQRGDL